MLDDTNERFQDTTEKVPPLSCDVCQKGEGFRGMNLQICCKCGVCVHEECYGLQNTNTHDKKYLGWECHACRIVGIHVVGRTEDGVMKNVQVRTRPQRCVLCHVNSGVHAMHPLYDKSGEDGRPLVIRTRKDPQDEIAWVHTLCASFINAFPQTKSLVYGCYEDGSYNDDDGRVLIQSDSAGNEDDNDYESIDLDYRMGGVIALKAYPHHYVIVEKTDGEENDWTLRLNEMRNSKLKCFVCGHTDELSHRIPVQCSADEQCYVAFHVGCARWDNSGKANNRIIFRPSAQNDEKNYKETTRACCEFHAQKRLQEEDRKRSSIEKDKVAPIEPIQKSPHSFDNSNTSQAMTKGPTLGQSVVNRRYPGKQRIHLRKRLMPYSRPRDSISYDMNGRSSISSTGKGKEQCQKKETNLTSQGKMERTSTEQQEVSSRNNVWSESYSKKSETGQWDDVCAPNYAYGALDLTQMDEVKTITREEVAAEFNMRNSSEQQQEARNRNSIWEEPFEKTKVGIWNGVWAPNYVGGALDLTKMDEVKTISKEEAEADFNYRDMK